MKKSKIILIGIYISLAIAAGWFLFGMGNYKEITEGPGKVPGADKGKLRYLELAESGNAVAQHSMGELYFYGIGAKQDTDEGIKWLIKAADQGYPKSQHRLGAIYFKGENVKQDYEKALKWLIKAAEQGHPRSLYNLGVMYSLGEGVPQNKVQAFKWWLLANSQDFHGSEESLAKLKKNMSKEEISQAIELASEFFEMHSAPETEEFAEPKPNKEEMDSQSNLNKG